MEKFVTIILAALALAIGAEAQTGTWSGKIEVQGVKLPLVFHLDGEKPTVDSPDQGVKDLPVQVERNAGGTITIRIPSIGATYEGLWMGKRIAGTFSQMGVALPLTLTPGEEKLNRPQTPKGPFPYATEEVSFSNGDAVLRGTLTLPQGWNSETPVLVMVTGSGFQNRDEEIFEHKPFAVIADAFARAGIATLRYDDRGFGESTGDVVNCTTEDLKNDALSGVRLLRGRFGKVGVIGHSEGGTIALALAAEGEADFIISLAGAVVSAKELMLWQNDLALEAAGFAKEDRDTYLALLAEAFDAVVSGSPLPSAGNKDLPDALRQNYQAVTVQAQTPYMRYFLAMDARPILGDITCPVLALNGSKDRQVEPESNIGALKAGLPENPKTHVEVVDGLNHLFQRCGTGFPTEYREIEETFSPETLDTMVRWILEL